MRTYKIHILRHGLTEANVTRRYIGTTDLPLSARGRAQLEQLAAENEYPGAGLIFSSPLRRAMQTAELLYPNREIILADKLCELDFGAFENRTIEDLEQDTAFRTWIASDGSMPTPGGESAQGMTHRAIEGLTTVFAQMMEQQIYEAVLVTHGGVISSLLAQIGLPSRSAVEWQCGPGEGFTLLLTAQMWMRDQKIEVYAHVPIPNEPPET